MHNIYRLQWSVDITFICVYMHTKHLCVSLYCDICFISVGWNQTLNISKVCLYYFVQSCLPSSSKSVSWDMITDFDRSRLRLFGFRVRKLPVLCDSELPFLVKPGLLQMHVIVHRKDSRLCACMCVFVCVCVCVCEREREREREREVGGAERMLFHWKNNSKRCCEENHHYK